MWYLFFKSQWSFPVLELNQFQLCCLRKVMGISWEDRVSSNTEVLDGKPYLATDHSAWRIAVHEDIQNFQKKENWTKYCCKVPSVCLHLCIEPWAAFSPLVSLMMSPSLTMDFHDDDADMRRHLSKYLFASGPVRTTQNFACFWKHFVNKKPLL